MNIVRVWPCLIAAMLLAPTALAAPGLSAERLEILGATELQGDASALFVVAGQQGFTWEVRADSALLTRRWVDLQNVDNPLKPGHYLVTNQMTFGEVLTWNEETVPLTDVTLTSAGVTSGGALLAVGQAAELETTAEGLVMIQVRTDPVIEQNAADAEAGDVDRGFVKAALVGEHILANLSQAEADLTGDITVQLFGPAYTLEATEAISDEQTGEYETARAGLASTTRREHHELILTGATLHLVAPSTIEVYSKRPEIAFSGELRALGAEGGLVLGLEEIVATRGALSWTGTSELLLMPSGGTLLAAAAAPTLATSGAIVDSGPRVALISSALTVLALCAIGAIIVFRLRSRRDDLPVAILAMEERRWDDALPALTRLAKKDPLNANVLVDRALCLEQTGRMNEAAKAFESALRSAPRNAEAHFYYARTLAKMSEREAARVHLETALEQDPRLVELARHERVLHGI